MTQSLGFETEKILSSGNITPDKIFVALDVPNKTEAIRLVEMLAPLGVSFKVGMQLFYAEGIPFVKTLQQKLESAPHSQIFIDLKLHDIPTTVAKASEALVEQGVTFFNLHTLGGEAMMRAASDAVVKTAERLKIEKPALIGVTVLTSHDPASLKEDLKIDEALNQYVCHLAALAQKAGLDGAVCSAQEASLLREKCGAGFLKVTPGIRLPEQNSPKQNTRDDQSRVLTPKAAFDAGATHLVIGRPITQAVDPGAAAQQLLEGIF